MITNDLNYSKIDASTFKIFLEDKKGIIVDLRTSEEYEEDHIKNSFNFDFSSSTFLTEVNKFPKDTPIFLYCNGGSKTTRAIQLLKNNGYNEVYGLKGGIIAWNIEQINE